MPIGKSTTTRNIWNFSQTKLRFTCTEKIQISMKSQHWTVIWHVVYIVYWLHAERGQFFASWISSGIYRPGPPEHLGAVGIRPNQRFVVVFPQSQCHCENVSGRTGIIHLRNCTLGIYHCDFIPWWLWSWVGFIILFTVELAGSYFGHAPTSSEKFV